MKKLFSVFLASLLLLQLSLFALADSSKSAAAAQQYSLQVIDNVMQFVKNDKVVRSVSLQNPTINLGKSKQGGIRVSVKDSTGKSRSFTLGSQTALTVSGELQSLQLSKSLPASASVSLEKGAKVESLKVNAACKVQLQGKVSQLKVTNANAKVTAEKSASIGSVSTVSANALSGISQAKITVSTAGSLSAGRDQMNDDSRYEDNRYDRDDDEDDDDRYEDEEQEEELPEDKPSVPDSQRYRITSIQSKPAEVLFSLNLPTEQPLTKENIKILCNGSGKDMTIVNVYTKDNQNYTVTTAYYADNEYFLSIQLADGSMINKTFTTSLLAPQLEKPFVEWSGENSVEITYVSDAAGSLYYLVQPVAAQTRNLWEEQEEPTVDQLKAKGTQLEMKVQSNRFTIDELDARTAYTLYYLAVDNFDRTSQIYTASIPAKTEQPEKSEITIVDMVINSNINIDEVSVHHSFDITLSEAPQEELTLDQFSVTCPQESDIKLGKLTKRSDTEYRVEIAPNRILKDNNNYTLTITFADGSTASKKAFLDYSAPEINSVKLNRTSETTAEVSFSSDTDGILYWKVLNQKEIPQDTSPKLPEKIIEGGNRVDIIGQTTNVLELENLTDETQYFCFVSEDEYGNRMNFYDYEKIPTYVAPEPPVQPEDTFNIASLRVEKDTLFPLGEVHYLYLSFDEEGIAGQIELSDITIRGMGVSLNGDKGFFTKSVDSDNPQRMYFYTRKLLAAGDYTITINLNGKTASKDFTIE
ncbi:putative uncharacterized protein [Clostridium sp. CAG:169]|nr:putative uncharacterized protein [Clostridium sp. CAG:169]